MVDLDRYKKLVYNIIGASMVVHRNLNYGLHEGIYEEALIIELEDKGINCETQKKVITYYKNRPLKKLYKIDVMVGDIICEL